METLALTFTSGWASGINSYLVVLVLGIADRAGQVDSIPDELGDWKVLAGAGVLYLIEFVADKVPWIDSTWDAISTVIRPVIGGVVGVLIAGEADAFNGVVGGVVGGGSAFASHAVKSGGRLALNTLPEPFTNVAASLTEDVAVFGVMLFAIDHPALAATIATVLLVLGVVALWFAIRTVRTGWRRWQERRGDRVAPPAGLP